MNSPDPSDDDLTDLLSEIRLLFPGTQILVAFLIILPFNSGYTGVSSLDNAVYVVTFVCAMISLLLFIAPAAQHRLMRPLRDRAAFKRSVNRQVIIGLIPLSLAITLVTFFVISNVVSNLAAGIVAGIVGLAIALLWWIIPVRNRRVARSKDLQLRGLLALVTAGAARCAGTMKYPDGGGLTAAKRGRRERVRLARC